MIKATKNIINEFDLCFEKRKIDILESKDNLDIWKSAIFFFDIFKNIIMDEKFSPLKSYSKHI